MLKNIPDVNYGTIVKANNKLYLTIEGNKSKQPFIRKEIDKLNLIYDEIMFVPDIPKDPRHKTKIDYNALIKMFEG